MRIDRAFADLLERPAGERRGALDELCGDDLDLRRELEELLHAEEHGRDFLAAPLATEPGTGGAQADPNADVGLRVGPYRLCEVIGRGGAAVVYRGRRDRDPRAPQLAVKLCRSEPGTAAARRFRQEWQILSQFDHPSITRFYDCGTTADGRLLLAMELVDGTPLDSWCDEHRLRISARLALFHETCNAVAYAHGHGVVHRDLKPQNVLVNRAGQVKLVDFGIAKLLNPGLLTLEPQPSTEPGLRVLTPGYASPEQVDGGKLTPATDVYSLGVLLFELLVGRDPYRLETSSLLLEVMEAVLERKPLTLVEALDRLAKEPERARELSRRRGVAGLGELRRDLGSELEAVVARTLAKKPEQRYDTAKPLADDVQRCLRGLPVRPAPGSPEATHRELWQNRTPEVDLSGQARRADRRARAQTDRGRRAAGG